MRILYRIALAVVIALALNAVVALVVDRDFFGFMTILDPQAIAFGLLAPALFTIFRKPVSTVGLYAIPAGRSRLAIVGAVPR